MKWNKKNPALEKKKKVKKRCCSMEKARMICIEKI